MLIFGKGVENYKCVRCDTFNLLAVWGGLYTDLGYGHHKHFPSNNTGLKMSVCCYRHWELLRSEHTVKGSIFSPYFSPYWRFLNVLFCCFWKCISPCYAVLKCFVKFWATVLPECGLFFLFHFIELFKMLGKLWFTPLNADGITSGLICSGNCAMELMKVFITIYFCLYLQWIYVFSFCFARIQL